MVVDVDETWVAYPFESKIGDFLSAHPNADGVSSNWLHCHGGELFENPLVLSNTKLRLTDQFKSLFRYGIAVTDLRAHAPWVLAEPEIRHTCSDGQPVLSKPTNGVRWLRKRGIQASINAAKTGWVIHRHTRSELEYASNCSTRTPTSKRFSSKPTVRTLCSMCCPTKAPAHANSPHSCSARGINPPDLPRFPGAVHRPLQPA